jgi:hypothetical protein
MAPIGGIVLGPSLGLRFDSDIGVDMKMCTQPGTPTPPPSTNKYTRIRRGAVVYHLVPTVNPHFIWNDEYRMQFGSTWDIDAHYATMHELGHLLVSGEEEECHPPPASTPVPTLPAGPCPPTPVATVVATSTVPAGAGTPTPIVIRMLCQPAKHVAGGATFRSGVYSPVLDQAVVDALRCLTTVPGNWIVSVPTTIPTPAPTATP